MTRRARAEVITFGIIMIVGLPALLLATQFAM